MLEALPAESSSARALLTRSLMLIYSDDGDGEAAMNDWVVSARGGTWLLMEGSRRTQHLVALHSPDFHQFGSG